MEVLSHFLPIFVMLTRTCLGVSYYYKSNTNITRIPLDIPATVTTVSLRSNQISEVDNITLGAITKLEKLILSSNEISIFPWFSGNKHTLIELDLSYNSISSIPESKLIELEVLSRLDVSNNEFSGLFILPPAPMLNKLMIGYNDITEMTIGNCPQLNEIELNNNKITNIEMTPDFENLVTSQLFLESNNIKANPFPGYLNNFKALRHLDLGSNEFTSLEFGNHTTLLELVMNNLDRCIHLHINNLPSLENLHVEHSAVQEIIITNCISLRYLDMFGSNLINLPEFSPAETGIEHMELEYNGIMHVFSGYFVEKTSLSYLNLKNNPLVSFDGSPMINIETLDLSHTDLNTFPCVLGMEGHIQNLYVADCNITYMTTTDACMDDHCSSSPLQFLDLSENPLEEFPIEMFYWMPDLAELTIQQLNLNTTPDLSMLNSLVILHAEYNNIASFSKTTLPSLRELYMRGNSIRSLSAADLKLMPQLEKLYLQSNNIDYLPDLREIMQDSGHTSLSIYLIYNELKCTKDICWMKEQINW